jgi:hypothetical protein
MAQIKLFSQERPKAEEVKGHEEAITYFPALPCGGNAFVTVMTQKQLDTVTYEPSIVYDKRVQRLNLYNVAKTLEVLRQIQRPVAGAKAKNVDSYAEYQVDLARGDIAGIIPPRILWTAEPIKLMRLNGQSVAAVPHGTRAFLLDGETGKAAADEARKTEPRVEDIDVPVVWIYGLPIEYASQVHHDLNLLGTRPTIPVALNLDRRDPVTAVAKKIAVNGVFGGANRVVLDKRQVSKADAAQGKIMTLASLRGFVAGIALGKSAIGRATAPVRRTDIPDMNRLKAIAGVYAKKIADHPVLGKQLPDRDSMLSVGAVQVVLGTLAHEIAADATLGDRETNDRLDRIVADLAKVKWSRGPLWNGIAGKVNPDTKAFSVGGSKEYGYAIHRALTDAGDDGWKRIRG